MSKKPPIISVVVPCFQVENFLERCVNSILNQTFKNFEIILVDDGSTDATRDICDFYAYRFPTIKVIHKENGGLSDARNVGIENAVGEYICFIDSDDSVHPDYLRILFEMIESTDADISVCSYREVNEPCLIYDNITESEVISYSGAEAVRELILSDRMMNYAWNKLYRRLLFLDIKYPVGKRWEDIGTTYKLFDESKKVVYTSSQLYFYLRRTGSITASKNIFNSLDQYELLTERYWFLKEDYPELCDALETQLCVCSYNCWSFLLTFDEKLSDEIKVRTEECIAYLDKKGRSQLKRWKGYENEKYKIKLYFYCRWLLRLLIKIKRS